MLTTYLLLLPRAHPFTELEVLQHHLHVAFEVAARPAFLPSLFREEFAFLVGVGVLLPAACASDRLLVFQLRFDPVMSGATLSAYELYASTSPLVIVQRHSCEAQMAQLATFHAGVRLHIARAEAPGSASQAHCVSFVPSPSFSAVLTTSN